MRIPHRATPAEADAKVARRVLQAAEDAMAAHRKICAACGGRFGPRSVGCVVGRRLLEGVQVSRTDMLRYELRTRSAEPDTPLFFLPALKTGPPRCRKRGGPFFETEESF